MEGSCGWGNEPPGSIKCWEDPVPISIELVEKTAEGSLAAHQKREHEIVCWSSD
jgi:hypothetical protein